MKPQAASTTSFDVTAIGEALLRFSAPLGEHLSSATSLRVHVGGAESNVCAALAQLGWRTGWASQLPRNDLGRLVLKRLREVGINVEHVRLHEDGRLGTYYLSSRVPHATTVIYDRKESSFCSLTTRDLDLDGLLDTRVFHSTGITPALGSTSHQMLQDVADEARNRGISISFDVNYREKLLAPKDARRLFSDFLAVSDIVFCSLRDAQRLFGAPSDAQGALAILEELTPAELLIVSNADSGVFARHHGADLVVPAVPACVLDRPGAGDALAAGVLDGVLQGAVEDGLQRGAALASIALAQYGDMVITSRDDLDAAMAPVNEGIVR